MMQAGCQRRPQSADGDGVSGVWIDDDGVARVERRQRRSRAPAVSAAIGFVVATLIADVLILAALGESVLGRTAAKSGWTDPATWWAAILALRDPAVALASAVLGGLPGALAGHTLAVRRLRRDRLEASLFHGWGSD